MDEHCVWERAERVLREMIEQQRAKVLAVARALQPETSAGDLLSPQDFPALARSPEFNYEDGILAGLLSALAALRAERRAAGG